MSERAAPRVRVSWRIQPQQCGHPNGIEMRLDRIGQAFEACLALRGHVGCALPIPVARLGEQCVAGLGPIELPPTSGGAEGASPP